MGNETATGYCGKQTSQTRYIVHWEDGRFSVEEGLSRENFKNTFVKKNLALIKHVDHDIRIQLEDVHQQGSPGGVSWGPEIMQAPNLWNQNIKGAGVVVAVIDGMVDVNHNQLAPNILINTAETPGNGIDDDGNGFVDDYRGIQVNKETNNPGLNVHGSHVAGIIAADSSQGPIVGVAQKAKILPAQFIGNDGGGSIGEAIVAMNYAASRGAKIINMSWGVGPCIEVPSLQAAMRQLSDAGLLLVTAAGNGDNRGVGINVDVYPTYPSAYNLINQINVAASTFDDYIIGFSNYGVHTVHIAAPGVNIYSTIPGNSVESMSGTSMAAPMVSGAAALLWSAIPSASASQIKQAISKGVNLIPGRPFDVSSRGRLNVNNAYTELKKLTGH